MTQERLLAAIKEAKRFLERAEKLDAEIVAVGNHYAFGTKNSGAVRRASMDLSRALSSLRKSR
jgi:hypothetical protein